MSDGYTSKRCEDFVMLFGRHKGKRLGDILDEDATYLDWLLTAEISNQRLYAAVVEINEKYAEQIEQALQFRRSERF